MRIAIFVFFIATMISCQNKSNMVEAQGSSVLPFFVGTYTGPESDSKGIYKYSLDVNGVLTQIGVAANSVSPSFLAKSVNDKYLLAVNEINIDGSGTIESYKIHSDTLQLINKSMTGGAHPCFVTVNKNGDVLVANYTGGNVGLLHQNENGRLSPLLNVEQHIGKGTTERQEAPHAHSVWFDPIDEKVISVDLGTNELWFSQVDQSTQKLTSVEPQKLKMRAGAGPRHLAFHPNKKWIYVMNELSCEVAIVRRNSSESYELGGAISTLPVGYTDPNTCADIHVTSDGKFVYASNRGHNTIAIYQADPQDGTLTLLGFESTKGDGPRNFSLSPDEKYLLVANQLTDNIVSFRRNQDTGLLTFVSEVSAPTPVCILF